MCARFHNLRSTAGQPLEYIPTTCPYCSCGCGLLVHHDGEHLLSAHPSSIHPVARGGLCVRGWNCVGATAASDRLCACLTGRGADRQVAPWWKAVEKISNALTSAPRGEILFVLGASLALEDALAAVRLAEFLDATVAASLPSGVPPAREALRAVLGRSYGAASPEVLREADVLWVFGADLHMYPQLASRVSQAARAGAEVVAFDVVSAGAAATSIRHVTVPPNNLRVVPLLLESAAFLADRFPPAVTQAPGFARLAALWRRGRGPVLPDHPWLPDDQAAGLVERVLQAERPAAVVGERWLTAGNAAEQTKELLQCLALLGFADRICFAAGDANSWGVADLLEDHAEEAEHLAAFLGGCTSFSVVVLVEEDILRRTPRPAAVEARLREAHTVVLLDRFQTATLPWATVALPTLAFGELDGTLTSAFGLVQHWRAIVRPPPAARPVRVWLSRIGRRVGMETGPSLGTGQDWFRRVTLAAPAYAGLERQASRLVLGRVAQEQGGMTFTEPATRLADAAPPAPGRSGRFPLQLMLSGQAASWSTGSLSDREDLLAREAVHTVVRLAAEDLAGIGGAPGRTALIRVVTPHAEAFAVPKVEPGMPPGVVLLAARPGDGARALQGFYPDPPALGVQPVPARLELP